MEIDIGINDDIVRFDEIYQGASFFYLDDLHIKLDRLVEVSGRQMDRDGYDNFHLKTGYNAVRLSDGAPRSFALNTWVKRYDAKIAKGSPDHQLLVQPIRA